MTEDTRNPMDEPRYSGIPTFMRTPLSTELEGLDIALVGVPYDGAVEARSGARQGPRQIRDMSSMMRTIHHVTRINPYQLCRIADVGDVNFKQIFDVVVSHADIADFYERLHNFGIAPLSAGGDHSITLPIMRAIAAAHPVGMVHIDAHTDCCDAEARRVVGEGPTYISFDIDSIDPSFAPGTGTPEIGGITTIEAQGLIRGLRGLNLVGADVVEVSPPFDQSGNTALIAATIMYEILCILAEKIYSKLNDRRG